MIAGLGGIQFCYFEPFLESEDEMIRGAAAEQLVILAKVSFTTNLAEECIQSWFAVGFFFMLLVSLSGDSR